MPFCSCIRKRKITKEKGSIADVINYACKTSYNMLMADVYGMCNDFIECKGWYFKYRTSFSENYIMNLVIEIRYTLDNLICDRNDGASHDECVVCTDKTTDLIVCCNQAICKNCLQTIKKHQPDKFLCPMCRKDLNTLTKTYILTKEDVKKRTNVIT
jgi:hypothetical protein